MGHFVSLCGLKLVQSIWSCSIIYLLITSYSLLNTKLYEQLKGCKMVAKAKIQWTCSCFKSQPVVSFSRNTCQLCWNNGRTKKSSRLCDCWKFGYRQIICLNKKSCADPNHFSLWYHHKVLVFCEILGLFTEANYLLPQLCFVINPFLN